MMDFNEALKAVQGGIRFMRALETLEEVLAYAVEAKQLLTKLDQETDAKKAELDEVRQDLAQVKEDLAAQADLLEASIADAKKRAVDAFDMKAKDKQVEIYNAEKEISNLRNLADGLKKEIKKLEVKRDKALDSAAAAQTVLEDRQAKYKAFIAKITE